MQGQLVLYCKISGLVSLSKSYAGFLNNFSMKLNLLKNQNLFSPPLPSPLPRRLEAEKKIQIRTLSNGQLAV